MWVIAHSVREEDPSLEHSFTSFILSLLGTHKVEKKAKVLLLIPCDPHITILQPCVHLTSTCDGDGVDPVGHKNDARSAQDTVLDPIITLDICTGHAMGRPYADLEPAPGHHTSDTMDPFQTLAQFLKLVLEQNTSVVDSLLIRNLLSFMSHVTLQNLHRRHAAAPDIISNVVPGSIRVPGYDT
ncbi:uncharacterized protein LOC143270060 isoform X1 [Peromyscus maniculatus bairdii]|uniref:uncharacterized protein LOC143270060 isoform X1 n=1 Tax=Peromyscus maniculatus bairdii TaxID=230844 RepID=UPI003FD2CF63